MNRPLPPELRREAEAFALLMTQKGDPFGLSSVLKLKKAISCDSPVLDAHIKSVCKNAITPGYAPDLTDDEQQFIGEFLLQVDAWKEGKPGPSKEFPVRVDLRISSIEQNALDTIGSKTGEQRSAIIRRLIREADPAPIQ